MPEFFTGIGQLLSGSFLPSGALWTLTNVPGFPPIIQTVHILGIAVVMATIAFQSLRILGLAVPSQNLSEITQRVMPIFWIALIIMIFSGSFFVFGRPNRYFNNPVFAVKMICLGPLLIMMAYYQCKTNPDWSHNSNSFNLADSRDMHRRSLDRLPRIHRVPFMVSRTLSRWHRAAILGMGTELVALSSHSFY